MNLKKNIFFKLLVIGGVALFVLIAYIVIRSTSTITAVVPNQSIREGTTITEDMLKEIPIPVNTPTGYITDKGSLVGQRLRIAVDENQLLYVNDVMTSWQELIDGQDIPDNYVITSMTIPSDRAVGGLITAGDCVDILGVPNSYYNTVDNETMKSFLGDIAEYDSYGADGLNVYWVLANVKILETDSTLASQENSSISTVTEADDSTKNAGSYYIVALSYADYQKLRLCENYLNLWLSLVPNQNEENGPLYDQMRQSMIKMMQDSQNQSDDYLLYGNDPNQTVDQLYDPNNKNTNTPEDAKKDDAAKEGENAEGKNAEGGDNKDTGTTEAGGGDTGGTTQEENGNLD